MLSASETGEVYALIEGGGGGGAAAASTVWGATREPWLSRGLLQYQLATSSLRALDLLARAPDPHAKHLLDALAEDMAAGGGSARRALCALAPLMARRPIWVHRLTSHPLLRAVTRAARCERAAAPRLHALLALAALLPHAPAVGAPLMPDLLDALLRPAADNSAPPATQQHLLLAQHALFHVLYATHPCTLLDVLRHEHASREPAARDSFERALMPFVETVRLHPQLVFGSRAREQSSTRWARFETHDVLAECRRLSLEGREEPPASPAVPAARAAPPPPASPAPSAAAQMTRAAASLRPGAEPWFELSERCGVDSAPHTPLPAEAAGGGSPPEAAVEATPENTPAKEQRSHFTFPAESAAVRAIGRQSQPPSPLRKEMSPLAPDGYNGRLARIMRERERTEALSPGGGRRARPAESPVPFGGAPPAQVARPEPSRPEPPDTEPLNVEDREVRELTARGGVPPDTWGEEGGAVPTAAVARSVLSLTAALRSLPRRAVQLRSPASGPKAPAAASCPPRRAASCPPQPRAARAEAAAQTVDAWPEPHEHLLSDMFRGIADESRPTSDETSESETVKATARLDAYLARLYEGDARTAGGELAEQLALTHAQLMYERWRREAHAERNRRLLGRCRQTRALELTNTALRDRLRALHREHDELRARLHARAPMVDEQSEAAAAEHVARLEASMTAERCARERAEAMLRECEAHRAADGAELQRLRSASFEASRRVDSLCRAAEVAERRAEHVRRMRRELLILGERETRLSEALAASAPLAASTWEREARQARAEAAAAHSETEAACARADCAAARLHALEQALAARDAALAELKRQAQSAADEHAARIQSVQDKYRSLMHVMRRMEVRKLELLAGAAGGGAGAGAGASSHSSPLSASLASGESVLASRPALADCSRVRSLVDDEPLPSPNSSNSTPSAYAHTER